MAAEARHLLGFLLQFGFAFRKGYFNDLVDIKVSRDQGKHRYALNSVLFLSSVTSLIFWGELPLQHVLS